MKRLQRNSFSNMSSHSFIRRHLLLLVIVGSLVGMALLPFQIFYLSSGDLASKSRAAGYDTNNKDIVNNYQADRANNNGKVDTRQKNSRQSALKGSGTSTLSRESKEDIAKAEMVKKKENDKCMFPDELTPIWHVFGTYADENLQQPECFKFQSTKEIHDEVDKMSNFGKESCHVGLDSLRTLEQATVYWNEDDLMIENDFVFTSASTICRFPERKLTRSKPKSSSDTVYQYHARDAINEAILILTDPEDDGAEIYMLSALRRLLDVNQDLVVLLQANTLRTKAWYDLFNFQPDLSFRLRVISGSEQVKKLHLLRPSGFCGRASPGCKLNFRNWLLDMMKSARLDFVLQMFNSGPSMCLLYRADLACAFPNDDDQEDINDDSNDEKETCIGLAAALTRELKRDNFMPDMQISHIPTDGAGFTNPNEALEVVSRISQCDSFISLNELPLFHEILHKKSARMLRFGLAGDVLDDSFENDVEHDTISAWKTNYSVYFPKTKSDMFQIARKFVKGESVVANSFHDHSKACSHSSKDKFQPYPHVKDNDCFPISAKLKKLKPSKSSKAGSSIPGGNFMDNFMIKSGITYSFDITKEGEQWWSRYKQPTSQHVFTRQIDHVTIYPVVTEDDPRGNVYSKTSPEPRHGMNDKRSHHVQSDVLWTILDACVDTNSSWFQRELTRLAPILDTHTEVARWVDEAVVLPSSQLFGTHIDTNFAVDFLGLSTAREILESNSNAKVLFSMMSEQSNVPSHEIAELLDLLEIDPSRILFLDAYSSVKVNKLHLSFPIHCGLPGHDTAKHMRKWIRDVNQYVYAERKGHPRKNTDIVLLAKWPFEIQGISSMSDALQQAFPDRKVRYLDIYDTPVRTQMEILARAEFMIGPCFGSYLSRMIFLPDYGKVIDVMSDQSENIFLGGFGLAQSLDLQYKGVLATELRGSPPHTYHVPDPEYIIRAIKSMMISSTS